MEKPTIKKAAIAILLCVAASLFLFICFSHINSNSNFEICFLDVGQADAAIINCDGKWMLIDGGNPSDSRTVFAALKARDIQELDYIICSHVHDDHIGGLPGALNYCGAKVALCPHAEGETKAFNSFVKYLGDTPITVPEIGDVYSFGSASFSVLGVYPSASSTNNSSIVLKITYGKTSFLFTGDAEISEEDEILSSGIDVSADVLKVGHHGSDTSTSGEWLTKVNPSIAVISVGAENSYGHPSDSVLYRLENANVAVYRTDMLGDITINSDGKNITVASSHFAPESVSPNTSDSSEIQNQTDENSADYVVNTNTKKFHIPSCLSVTEMKEKYKWFYTGSRDELLAQGYAPCGRCQP